MKKLKHYSIRCHLQALMEKASRQTDMLIDLSKTTEKEIYAQTRDK